MARVPWQFNGYSWDVNPEKDSGWVYEDVLPETVAIGAPKSSFQFGGRKSGRRQISGYLFGVSSLTQYNIMKSWRLNRTKATLVDHFGNASTARMVKFEAEPIQSAMEWRLGRASWRYNAEFIEE